MFGSVLCRYVSYGEWFISPRLVEWQRLTIGSYMPYLTLCIHSVVGYVQVGSVICHFHLAQVGSALCEINTESARSGSGSSGVRLVSGGYLLPRTDSLTM